MNKKSIIDKKRNVKSALGSVRAEGMNPSNKTVNLLNNYTQGKITISEMRASTLADLKKKN